MSYEAELLEPMRQAACNLGHEMSNAVVRADAARVLGRRFIVVSECLTCHALVGLTEDDPGWRNAYALSALLTACARKPRERFKDEVKVTFEIDWNTKSYSYTIDRDARHFTGTQVVVDVKEKVADPI